MVSQQPESFIDPIEIQNENNWEEEVLRIFGNSAGNLQVFDSAGNLKADTYQMENDGAEADPMDYYYSCEKYISEVKEKRSIRKFTMVYDADQKAHRVVYIYGVSVENGNEMIGEAFVVHSPLYFSRTLRVFLAFFTAAYVIAAVSVILVLSMRRRYDDARQKYIDNVTHALKTPVTSIKALAETLYDGVESDPEEQRYNLQLILQQADLQVDMVQNILKLSRLQTYGVKPEKIKVSSEELVKDPVKKHLPECEQKNISLEISSHLQELPQLYTDPDMVRQILDAVLDNAVKFTPEGGSIVINGKVSGKMAILEVRDTGIGIPKEQLNSIFERFYTSSAGNAEGNGLGLAIAKELTKLLKENIWAESEAGKGTSIFLTVKISK